MRKLARKVEVSGVKPIDGADGAFLNDYINTKMGIEEDKNMFWKEHRNLILPNWWVKARLMKTWRCKGNK